MPFDTTYHIYSNNKNTIITVPKKGGANIDIFLGPGELPPGMDSLPGFLKPFQTVDNTYEPKVYEEHKYLPGPIFICIFIAIFIFFAIRISREKDEIDAPSEKFSNNTDEDGNPVIKKAVLTYYGDELNFTTPQYDEILSKHFPYYGRLDQNERSIFLYRLNKFISDKTFKIHGENAFKEMPVLISASAIQLTFGLKKYLLPNFQFIHIFPQEFMRVEPVLCFLEGNVSGHSINLSWKHFLAGLQDIADGKNVGLHEMAHALYYQTFVMEENVDLNFRDGFNDFNHDGNKAYDMEMVNEAGLYSEYAMTNFQEFWAESVELFFEKPKELYKFYPNLYIAMADLLNQRPVNFA